MATPISIAPTANPWLAFVRPHSHRAARLFCFPYAGGGAHIFRAWADHLPANIEVCPVQLPGRGTRIAELPQTDIHSLVESAAASLLPVMQEGPFAFFGHSMGALVSFELARYLRRQACVEPSVLFVSGCRAPQTYSKEFRKEPSIYQLSDPEFINELRRMGGTPAEFFAHPELVALTLPLLRADFQAVQTYVCEAVAPLHCPIVAWGGLQDSEISPEQLAMWESQTTARFSTHWLPGDHFFIHSASASLLDQLRAELTALTSECASVANDR